MTDEMTADKIAFLGYVAPRRLDDGRWVALLKMLFTTGLFVGIDQSGYQTRFCYEHMSDAIAALIEWDGIGDPPGPWIKEKPSDRLNPNWAMA